MIYLEYFPQNELSRFVDKIWYCKADNLTRGNLTIPLPHHELVFNFSEDYKIRKAGENEFSIQNPVAWINGLQSKAYYSYSSGKHEMLGVLFKANGLRAFINFDAVELSQNFIHADLVFGNTLSKLIDQLQNTSAAGSKVLLAEKFLLNNLKDFTSPKYLSYSLQQLSGTIGAKGSISSICNTASVSNKSLIQAYRKHVGISPVKYSHLQALNKALILLANEPKQSLTKLAYSLNFFDQSHFNYVFKSLTSLIPSEYVAHIQNNNVDVNYPNFISLPG